MSMKEEVKDAASEQGLRPLDLPAGGLALFHQLFQFRPFFSSQLEHRLLDHDPPSLTKVYFPVRKEFTQKAASDVLLGLFTLVLTG